MTSYLDRQILLLEKLYENLSFHPDGSVDRREEVLKILELLGNLPAALGLDLSQVDSINNFDTQIEQIINQLKELQISQDIVFTEDTTDVSPVSPVVSFRKGYKGSKSVFLRRRKDLGMKGKQLQGNTVFIITPFSNPQVNDVYEFVIVKKLESIKYKPERLDFEGYIGDFVLEFMQRISEAAFVIVDLTDSRVNCYFEYGLAIGYNKHVVPIAQVGTTLGSDVRNMNTLFYEDLRSFKNVFSDHIDKILERYNLPNPYEM